MRGLVYLRTNRGEAPSLFSLTSSYVRSVDTNLPVSTPGGWHSSTICRSTSDSRQGRTHPTSQPQSDRKYGDSRSQEREPVSTLDGWMAPRTFPLMKNPSLYLERAALHLNLHPYRSFWLTCRNHTARRPKSAVYAEVICRKC